MKPQARKLTLNRQTINRLEEIPRAELRRPVAGYEEPSCFFCDRPQLATL